MLSLARQRCPQVARGVASALLPEASAGPPTSTCAVRACGSGGAFVHTAPRLLGAATGSPSGFPTAELHQQRASTQAYNHSAANAHTWRGLSTCAPAQLFWGKKKTQEEAPEVVSNPEPELPSGPAEQGKSEEMWKTMSKAGERLSKHLSPEEQAELMASMQAIAAAPMRMRDKQVMLRVQPVLLRAATDPDLGPALQGFMSRGKAVPTMSELGILTKNPRALLKLVRDLKAAIDGHRAQ